MTPFKIPPGAPLILGIAGPSCSGKSTVARLVADAAGAELLHLDAHWLKGCARPLVNGEPSHERPEQYDGAALAGEALRLSALGKPVVVEGFLLFVYPEAWAACEVKIFLSLDASEAAARRSARSVAFGDFSQGGKEAAIERAWLANGMTEWERYGAGQALMPGVTSVDASLSAARIASDIAEVWIRNRKG